MNARGARERYLGVLHSKNRPDAEYRLLCGGQCLVLRMGSRENMVPVTLALLLFPTMLWFLFIMGHLTNELGRAWSWGVAGVICLSLGAAVYFLCVSMLTEPGLLFSHDPRARSPRSFGGRGMIDDDDDDDEEEDEEDEDDNEAVT